MGPLGTFIQSRKVPNSFACLSLRPYACISAAPIGGISLKFHIGDLHEDLLKKSKLG